MRMVELCNGTIRKGEPCKSIGAFPAEDGRPYCAWHNPTFCKIREEAKEMMPHILKYAGLSKGTDDEIRQSSVEFNAKHMFRIGEKTLAFYEGKIQQDQLSEFVHQFLLLEKKFKHRLWYVDQVMGYSRKAQPNYEQWQKLKAFLEKKLEEKA